MLCKTFRMLQMTDTLNNLTSEYNIGNVLYHLHQVKYIYQANVYTEQHQQQQYQTKS